MSPWLNATVLEFPLENNQNLEEDDCPILTLSGALLFDWASVNCEILAEAFRSLRTFTS